MFKYIGFSDGGAKTFATAVFGGKFVLDTPNNTAPKSSNSGVRHVNRNTFLAGLVGLLCGPVDVRLKGRTWMIQFLFLVCYVSF